jgi:redox-sensitive bicupin YhaK (pirin superfamily)
VSESTVAAEACAAIASAHQQFDAYPAREVALGQLAVVRALPVRGKRLIGPWCFLDRFGPATFVQGGGMDVAPHPHIGLQTVTWLLDGEIVHDDSLEQEALLRPGGVNIMTSGRAIAHAERTPHDNTGRLNGVQLWTALPIATGIGLRRSSIWWRCLGSSQPAASSRSSRALLPAPRRLPSTFPI